MRLTMGELMDRLEREGVATAADVERVRVASSASVEQEMPIYLRALVGVGAWVATIMLLAFFYALHLLDGTSGAIALGVVLIGAATVLRGMAKGEFTRHATVAASFAGQGLILSGMDRNSLGDGNTFITAAIISIVMIIVFPDGLHRFVSTLIAVGASAAALVALGAAHALDIAALVTVVLIARVWRADVSRRSDELTEMLLPVGYGLPVALFGICLFGAFYSVVGGSRDAALVFGAITTDGVAVMLAALVLVILREHDTSPSGIAGVTILVIIALFAALTLKSPGIIIGVGMLLLGFDRRNLVLIELATAFLIVFGAANYYNLALTLLEKSGILIASGALCLVARLLVNRLLDPGKEALPT